MPPRAIMVAPTTISTADEVAEFVTALIASWTPLPINDVEATDCCSICLEPLVDHASNKAVKTACQHVFGASCIIEWTVKKRIEETIPTCPVCRANIVEPQPHESDQQVSLGSLRRLEAWYPGTESRDRLDKVHIDWMCEAEELWEVLVVDIKDLLDSYRNAPRIDEDRVDKFLDNVKYIGMILSCGEVYNFYLAQRHEEGWLMNETLPGELLPALADLSRYLRGIPPGLPTEAWREYRAFNGPPDDRRDYDVWLRQAHRDLCMRARRTG